MATGRRRGRAIIYIALILILLLVLVFAVMRFGGGIPGMSQAPNNGESMGTDSATSTPVPQSIEVVVTSQDIKRGQEITDDRITTVQIPIANYTEGEYFNTKAEVLGSKAMYDLKAATPLTPALVIPFGSISPVASFEIPRGMVAISVPLSKLSSVSYGIQKGDHVNVIASLLMIDLDTEWQSSLPSRTGYVLAPGPIIAEELTVTSLTARNFMPPEYTTSAEEALSYMGRIEMDPTSNNPMWVIPAEEQRPRLVSQTLIQDVVVLQLGEFSQSGGSTTLAAPQVTPQPGQQQVAAEEVTDAAASNGPNVVTLIVSPQDAVTLNYLMLAGANLNLVLRSAGDDQRVDTEAVTLQFVLDQYRIPNPAKLPYGTEPRIDSFPEYIPAFPQPGPSPTPVQ